MQRACSDEFGSIIVFEASSQHEPPNCFGLGSAYAAYICAASSPVYFEVSAVALVETKPTMTAIKAAKEVERLKTKGHRSCSVISSAAALEAGALARNNKTGVKAPG